MAEVLRYPYDLLTNDTDYLQIDLVKKTYAGQQELKEYERATADQANSTAQANNATLRKLPGKFKGVQLTREGGFAKVSGTGLAQGKLSDKFISSSEGIIILPIPSNIADSNSVNYSEDKLDAVTALAGTTAYNLMQKPLTSNIGAFLTSAKNEVTKAVQASGMTANDVQKIFLGNLAAQAAGIAGVGNLTLDQILARSEGQILNPNMELLFNGPTIRSFKFSFKFTPRSQKEANQVKLIIGSLKRHMAPVVREEAKAFLGTPNFFELRYKHGQDNHSFLHKFKKCVLQDMSVNYTGENTYATYSDGTPVSMIMDLTFKELEPIYSSDYSDTDRGVGY